MRLPSAVCAGSGGQSHPVRASSEALGRAQLPTKYRAGHGCRAHDGGQTAKKAAVASPPLPRLRLERPNAIDEMWTFVGRRKRKVWLGLAVGRASRRIVPWVLGCRSAATAHRLWAALPHRYQHYCRYHTNQWEACAKVLPARYRRPRPKGRGNTNIVEAFNCLTLLWQVVTSGVRV